MKDEVAKKVDDLVTKYPSVELREIFRAELEHLVILAEIRQMNIDFKSCLKIIKKDG